ncbi:MAG: peptidoglycan-binding domain-containing protein [Beijerinckiaceae bacterium]
MREALARSDHDFVVSEPRSRGAKRRVGLGGFFVGCLRWAYRAAAYPNRVAATLLIAILLAILINALVLQSSRHPAPLFGRSIAVPAAPGPTAIEKHELAAAASAAAENQKPAPDPISQLLKPGTAPHPATSLRKQMNPEAVASEAKPAQVRDPITQILKAKEPQQQSGAEPNKIVLAAQRALVRLGFVLRPDGVNGAATRQALEQFERDRGLPVKGELTPKILRELAAQSGQAIE